MPRRTAVGVDNQRLSLILAVLEKKLRVPFYNSDVYVNVVGGLNIDGTYGDLGIVLALIPSVKAKEIKIENLLIIGEVGLTGEVRPIAHAEKIINEAIKMGFTSIILPNKNKAKITNKGINLIGVDTVREAVSKIF